MLAPWVSGAGVAGAPRAGHRSFLFWNGRTGIFPAFIIGASRLLTVPFSARDVDVPFASRASVIRDEPRDVDIPNSSREAKAPRSGRDTEV
jgi:hypothetical protein